jgi:5,10-methylene-tetrahydrofolate dehydrogenase/methenyl tetrahydrofolate cyclohydrolase
MNELIVYYDNPNKWSDMYLKWLQKDCDENDIKVKITDNFQNLIWELAINDNAVLPLFPVKDSKTEDDIVNLLKDYPQLDVDNISHSNKYSDATAEGIFNYIKDNFKDRSNCIGVVGRGKVGMALIDMLIGYRYTVLEFNSATPKELSYQLIKRACDVVVGLSSKPVYNANESNAIGENTTIIDASSTFDTKDKLKCGKWTREVVINRIKEINKRA